MAELSAGGPLPRSPVGELEEHDLSGEHILHMDLPDTGICRILTITPSMAPIAYLSYPQTYFRKIFPLASITGFSLFDVVIWVSGRSIKLKTLCPEWQGRGNRNGVL